MLVGDHQIVPQRYFGNVAKPSGHDVIRVLFVQFRFTTRPQMNPTRWAEESHQLCADFVYTQEMYAAVREVPTSEKLPPFTLSPDDLKQAGTEARRRVIAAGVRLGVMLDGEPIVLHNNAAAK